MSLSDKLKFVRQRQLLKLISIDRCIVFPPLFSILVVVLLNVVILELKYSLVFVLFLLSVRYNLLQSTSISLLMCTKLDLFKYICGVNSIRLWK